MKRSLGSRPFGVLACLLLATVPARADETCRYAGDSDYGGRLAIETRAVTGLGGLYIDVRLRLDASPLPLVQTHYLMQEISVWRHNGLAQLAVNSRYRFDGHVVRQQWDLYDRIGSGLAAYRLQGKHAAEFRRRYPAFAGHWDQATFGAPWLGDYAQARPERRPDLDLSYAMQSVRPPLGMAFYWLRWLDRPKAVPIYLPGFKEQKLVEVGINRDSAPLTWQAALHYPGLGTGQPSTVTAAVSTDRHLLRLGFDLHGVEHSARARISLTGCSGTLPAPP